MKGRHRTKSQRVWNKHLSSERTKIERNLVEKIENPAIIEREFFPERKTVLKEEKNLPMVVKV